MRDIPTAVAQIMEEEGYDCLTIEGDFYPNCQGMETLLSLQARLIDRLEHRCRVELVLEAGNNQAHYKITRDYFKVGEGEG